MTPHNKKEKEDDERFYCIQDTRLDRMEQDINGIKKDQQEILQCLNQIQIALTRITGRLDKKRELNGIRDKAIAKEDNKIGEIEEQMDTLEREVAVVKSENKIILGLITALLIGFVIFFIEFNYKTFILGF